MLAGGGDKMDWSQLLVFPLHYGLAVRLSVEEEKGSVANWLDLHNALKRRHFFEAAQCVLVNNKAHYYLHITAMVKQSTVQH